MTHRQKRDTLRLDNGTNFFNPNVERVGPYTLRKTDVNPANDRARIDGKRIIDARLGDPVKFGLGPYRRYRQYKMEADDNPKNYAYSEACGLPELRQILSEGNVEFNTTGYAIPPNHVFIGAGISGVARAMFTTLIHPSNGDEVVIPEWSYIIYLAEAGLSNSSVKNVKLTNEGFPDLNQFEASITKNTKAVFITTVGNPLGVAMSHEMFGEIIGIVNKKEQEFNRPIYLVADTIYEGFRLSGPLDPIALSILHNRIGPTIEVYSISKRISAPGERLGWMRVYHNGNDFTENVHQFCDRITTLAQPSLGAVPTPPQLALWKLYNELDAPEKRQEFDDFARERRKVVRSRVQSTLEALMHIDGVVLPKYYYSGSAINPDILNSFYILFGVDHSLCPRGPLSQARLLADYLIENDLPVVLSTPGDSFLAHEYRGHKDAQEYVRVVALFEDVKGFADSVARFVHSLRN